MPANRVATALCLLPILGGQVFACVTDPDAQRMTAETDGAPDVYVIAGMSAVSQPTDLEIVVCPGTAKEVSGLVVDAWMPSHQHGMNYDPEIEALGEGRYSVTNMVYHMPGLWQLTITLGPDAERAYYTLDMRIQ